MNSPLLSFHDVSVRRGNRLVLHKLSFELNRGERMILEGENGSGKTTLLKTALGFLKPESGSVRTNRGITGDGFAYLPQESMQGELPISAREVVSIGLINKKLNRKSTADQTDRLLEALGCLHLAERSFAQLSGGEKQRVSLARCLAQAPDLLILDEPTASLDPAMRKRFYPLLLELAEDYGAAVLLVTHDLAGIPAEGWTRSRLQQEQGRSWIEARCYV